MRETIAILTPSSHRLERMVCLREHLDSLVASLRDAGYMVTTVELA